jgi:membrane-bound lytic murein transglycosylase MltF
MKRVAALTLLVALTFAPACSRSEPGAAGPAPAVGQSQPVAEVQLPATVLPPDDNAPLPEVPSPYDALHPAVRSELDKPFTGDFDEMVKRRLIRAGIVYNRTQYFIDKGIQKGVAYESVKLFEEQLNKRLKTGLMKVSVTVVPLTRDQLFPALESGKVDVIAAMLTVTPGREARVNFSQPTRTDISEIVVTALGAAPVSTPEDLSGRDVFVRKSSSYYESLTALNEKLAAAGKPAVNIKEAPEALEDDDILEMVNAGLVDTTVVDNVIVDFWGQVFTEIKAYPDVTLRSGGVHAVGVRKNNPRMLRAVNTWIREYGPRTAFSNIMTKRYMGDASYVRSAAAEAERRKLRELVAIFEKYGRQYSVDHLLMAAQGYQESRLDHNARSRVGAIGVMQIMPATGKDLGVGDITQLEPNIHGGVKYFRFMVDTFYKDEPMTQLDKGLMTFASYNAGPGRIRQLRRETARRGLDPNVWFGNVEQVVSEKIGRETVDYVSNIYKYYVAYRLIAERLDQRERARAATEN